MLLPPPYYPNRKISPVQLAWNHEIKAHLKSTSLILLAYWTLYTLTGLPILSTILPLFPCSVVLFTSIVIWTILIWKDDCDPPSHLLKQTIRFYQCYIDVAAMIIFQIIWAALVFMGFYDKFTPWFLSESANRITLGGIVLVSFDLFLQSSYIFTFIRTTKHTLNQERKLLPL